MEQNLIDLVEKSDYLTKWLGISIRAKLNAPKRVNYRLTALLVVMYAALAHSCVSPFIPSNHHALVWADVGYHFLGPHRYYMSVINFFWHLNQTLMVSTFYCDDLDWLKQANGVYMRIKGVCITRRTRTYVRRAQVFILLFFLAIWFGLLGFLYTSSIRFHGGQYHREVLPAQLYIVLMSGVSILISCKFVFQLYLICKIIIEMFELVNTKLGGQFKHCADLFTNMLRFVAYYRHFCKLCIFVNHINSFSRVIYIVYFCCLLPVMVPFFYVALFTNVETITRCIFGFYICYLVVLMMFVSDIIGQIDVAGKLLADDLYNMFVIKARGRVHRAIYFKLIKYFQHVWCSTISVEIMGKPINTTTSITIITVFLTILAFMIGNSKH